MSFALAPTLTLHPPSGYFGDSIEKWIAFVAGFLLAIVQKTPFQGQTLAAILLIFLLWIALKRYLLLYAKYRPEWEKHWGTAIKKLVSFISYTLFFLLFYFAVFLLQNEFVTNNLNVQEIVVIVLVFMLFLFTVFILYNNRVRRYQKWAQTLKK